MRDANGNLQKFWLVYFRDWLAGKYCLSFNISLINIVGKFIMTACGFYRMFVNIVIFVILVSSVQYIFEFN